MRKIKGEMVATKKDYFEAIVKAADAGADFGGLDVKAFAEKELEKLSQPKSRKVSDKIKAEQAVKDGVVLEAMSTFDAPKKVKAIAEVAEMSPQGVTAALKRLVAAEKVVRTEFEGISLYQLA